MLPIQKKFVKYNYSKRSVKPKYIVIHDTGNPSATALNHYNYFNGGNRSGSADFFVDSNNIIQIIDTDINYSWAVGDGKGAYGITNSNSCSIEMCLEKDGRPSEATIQNTVELTKYLMNYYGIDFGKVVRHYDASRKNCPQSLSSNNWSAWYDFKARLAGKEVEVNIPVATTPQPEKSLIQKAKDFVGSRCKELQEKLIKLGYNCGGYGADGQFGQGTLDSLLAFQKDNGLVVDGLAGNATFSKLDQLIAKKNSTSNARENVRKIQRLCNTVLKSGLAEDGIWGELTENAVRKLPLCGLPYVQRECTRFIQEVLGISIDGIFGNGTASTVKSFQKAKGLDVDGIVGFQTYKALAFK